jgi:UDP-N-acetylglucosamine 2-epimerase (non-hydrolysing)
MAPVIAVMAARPDLFDIRICVTAQHREMLDKVLPLFEIQPDYDLDLMRESQTLAQLNADILTSLDPIICRQKPDWILVQGDTTTAMAAALAGYYRHIRIGHVEAGLRTYDNLQPFPEEVNRRTTGILADIHFAPTEQARANLLREGAYKRRITVTGNTVIDALLHVVGLEYDFTSGPLAQIPFDKRILLVTAHRRESFGEPLQDVCRAIEVISKRHSEDVHIVYPVHLNPQVHNPVCASLAGLSNVALLEPLDYLSFVHLMNRSYIVLTDSGGLQEEAPSLGKPVLVLRNKTERPEAVQAGTARLVGTDADSIVNETERLLSSYEAYGQMANAANPYGDGHAAERICEALLMATCEKAVCKC